MPSVRKPDWLGWRPARAIAAAHQKRLERASTGRRRGGWSKPACPRSQGGSAGTVAWPPLRRVRASRRQSKSPAPPRGVAPRRRRRHRSRRPSRPSVRSRPEPARALVRKSPIATVIRCAPFRTPAGALSWVLALSPRGAALPLAGRAQLPKPKPNKHTCPSSVPHPRYAGAVPLREPRSPRMDSSTRGRSRRARWLRPAHVSMPATFAPYLHRRGDIAHRRRLTPRARDVSARARRVARRRTVGRGDAASVPPARAASSRH